jgi:hypothetical protein
MGGGGGGGSDVQMRDPKTEQKTVGNWYGFQQDQYGNFVEHNPLLNAAQGGALSFWDQLPQMLSQFGGFQKELGGYQNQLGALSGKLGGQANRLGNWLQSQVLPTIASHGALTPQMSRDVSQQTRAIAAAQGNAHSLGALGNELLNRDAYREQRFNQALQQGQGLLGQQSGIYGQQATLTGMGAGLVGQKAGLLGQQQAMQTGGLNQLLGVGNAGVSQYTGLTNPILGYLGNLFGGNQQASIAQAQINAQQQAAGDSKMGSTVGGIISAVGPILAAASDKRLKQKIKDTGLKTEDDVPIKTFEYKTNPGERMIGVLAQDVEKKNPDAVFTDFWSGLKLIDRTKVNIPMGRIA